MEPNSAAIRRPAPLPENPARLAHGITRRDNDIPNHWSNTPLYFYKNHERPFRRRGLLDIFVEKPHRPI